MWFSLYSVVCCWKNESIILSKTTGPYSHRKQPFASAIVNHNLWSFIITRNRNQQDNWKAKFPVEKSVEYNGSCPLRFLLRLLNNYESVWWKWKWKTPIWCSLAWLYFPRLSHHQILNGNFQAWRITRQFIFFLSSEIFTRKVQCQSTNIMLWLWYFFCVASSFWFRF